MSDLQDVIEDSLTDAELPEEPDTNTVADDTPVEPVEVAEQMEESQETSGKAEDAEDTAVKPEAPKPADDFEKKFGIPAQSATGRENRIPYSRVKKITEKAVNDKVKELEASYTPKIQDFETKIQDYEGRLQRVAEFEHVMVNNADKFLEMLSTLPTYQPFFDAVRAAFKDKTPAKPQEEAPDDMPQPNKRTSDGTMVYDLDGLRALNAWNRAQARKEVMQEVEKRYGPIEKAWQADQHIQAVIPQVQAQIAEARTWPMFNENEAEIVEVLKSNPKVSLEGAYRHVVFPKMSAERNKIREEVLKELKQAPKATSATTGVSKATATPATGPRNLEDVIREAAQTLK